MGSKARARSSSAMRLKRPCAKERASSTFCAVARPTNTAGVRSIDGTGNVFFDGRTLMTRSPSRHAPADGSDLVRAPLLRSARGELPPNVALMQAVMHAQEPDDIERAIAHAWQEIDGAGAAGRLHRLAHLWTSTPDAFRTVKKILAVVDHGRPPEFDGSPPVQWSSIFDGAAEISPEASAAPYWHATGPSSRSAAESAGSYRLCPARLGGSWVSIYRPECCASLGNDAVAAPMRCWSAARARIWRCLPMQASTWFCPSTPFPTCFCPAWRRVTSKRPRAYSCPAAPC